MKITRGQIRRIIKEELHQINDSTVAPETIMDPKYSRGYPVEIAKVEDVKKDVAQIRPKSYKPDQNEVWVAKEPGTPPQEQADQLWSWMAGGFPGGPVQWYWDPTKDALFVHVKYNTF